MKNIIFTLFFAIIAISATAHGGIISETQNVVDSGGIYYIQTVTEYDNGTPFPRTVTDYREAGADSLALFQYAADQVEARTNEVAIGINEAFKIRQNRQFFNNMNAIINTVSGGAIDLQDLLNERFAAYYGALPQADTLNGQYRINVGGTVTFGRMIRLGNGNYRLRLITEIDGPDVSPQVQYVFTPRSKNQFQLTYPVSGTVHSVWLNTLESSADRLAFFSLETLLPGTNTGLRSVVKVR